jgi:hypothetical protein
VNYVVVLVAMTSKPEVVVVVAIRTSGEVIRIVCVLAILRVSEMHSSTKEILAWAQWLR